ncbi:hypothetical protein CXB51_028758 [Gossypium anomalum]|uniref:Retrovirus-related Pol polyprotein from transposon TNT 1-94 n=1 Tax=Gossypium anomalum TaxID=47600 RepID=A0A8J5YF72_9ROSI|nr:hypothetical protein CXB51_028758 [Gossypium anomalum]
MKEKTVATLWKRLEQICLSKTLTSKLYMKQRLYAHHLEKGAPVHEHLSMFKEILLNLEAIEVQYDNEDLGLILLCSLPRSYSTFRDTILYSCESLTVDENQDRNIDDYQGKTQEWNSHGKSEGRSNLSNREDYSGCELLVAYVNNSKVNEKWILDSGCTFHMSPNRDCFTIYETVSECVVLIGNNASCNIVSIGMIKVKMFDRVVKTLSGMRHVPELKRNLISLSTLNSKKYKYTTESGVLKISKGFLVMMKGQRKTAKLYVLQGSLVTRLCHMRLGNMSENGMTELSKRGLLDGQGICKLKFCENCVFGKEKRVWFTRGIHNTKGTLEYIHSDLWVPSRVPSRGGANYMLTLIDNFFEKV